MADPTILQPGFPHIILPNSGQVRSGNEASIFTKIDGYEYQFQFSWNSNYGYYSMNIIQKTVGGGRQVRKLYPETGEQYRIPGFNPARRIFRGAWFRINDTSGFNQPLTPENFGVTHNFEIVPYAEQERIYL